ncbi:MAG: transposase [Spirochaetaceae bacterium]|jgi:putative transposase|nr:transposase [Spirochaetaceae bacterium]
MRKCRVLKEGAYYHVITRINRNDGFLLSKQAKTLFLKVLKEAQTKYRFILKNYTVMPNHYHLLIKPLPGENLSRIMQWINSVFAMRTNKLVGSTGHVWGQRFFSRVVQDIADSLRVSNYIDENAVKAQLVTHAEEWEFCHKFFLIQEQLRS